MIQAHYSISKVVNNHHLLSILLLKHFDLLYQLVTVVTRIDIYELKCINTLINRYKRIYRDFSINFIIHITILNIWCYNILKSQIKNCICGTQRLMTLFWIGTI